MSQEIKRFGGELEFANAKVKTSTYQAREEFFKILNKRKPEVFGELLNLFNPVFLPAEFRNDEKAIDCFTNLFLRNIEKSNLIKMDWGKVDIKPDIAKTPVVYYFDYLFKKQNELKKIVAEFEQESERNFYHNKEKYIKQDALKKLIPDWKNLCRDDEAEQLCESLIHWAKKFNLYEDWVMDMALANLRNMKIVIDELHINSPDANNQYMFSEFDMSHYKSKALSESANSYLWNSLNPDLFESYIDTKDYPNFNFNESGFEVNDTWMPGYTTKQVFTERVQLEFVRQTKAKLLKIYEGSNDFESVINDIQEIKIAGERLKKLLKAYCSKVLKVQPKGMVKTPVKKTGLKHFEWLIDFQINKPFEKTYKDIAEKNNMESKAISLGIQSISKIIGLKLRYTPKTGRPKGIKETKERANYSHW